MSKLEVKDTSQDYDHLIDYVAQEHLQSVTLDNFLSDEEREYRPEVRGKAVNPEFPEDWQTLMVNIWTFEDYVEFMEKIDSKPIPKLSRIVYESPENKRSIFDFLENE